MTLREAFLTLKNRYQQLELMNANRQEFEDIYGVRGLENRIDETLDEILFLKDFIEKKLNDESANKN